MLSIFLCDAFFFSFLLDLFFFSFGFDFSFWIRFLLLESFHLYFMFDKFLIDEEKSMSFDDYLFVLDSIFGIFIL